MMDRRCQYLDCAVMSHSLSLLITRLAKHERSSQTTRGSCQLRDISIGATPCPASARTVLNVEITHAECRLHKSLSNKSAVFSEPGHKEHCSILIYGGERGHRARTGPGMGMGTGSFQTLGSCGDDGPQPERQLEFSGNSGH